MRREYFYRNVVIAIGTRLTEKIKEIEPRNYHANTCTKVNEREGGLLTKLWL